MTLFNGSVPPFPPDPRAANVLLTNRAAAMAARLQVLQTLAAGIDSQAVPDAATIATGLAAEIVTLGTYGASTLNPVPA